MEHAVLKLKSASKYRDRRLMFLKNYEYKLGVEHLVPLGAKQ
jgi:hypothetical protein